MDAFHAGGEAKQQSADDGDSELRAPHASVAGIPNLGMREADLVAAVPEQNNETIVLGVDCTGRSRESFGGPQSNGEPVQKRPGENHQLPPPGSAGTCSLASSREACPVRPVVS